MYIYMYICRLHIHLYKFCTGKHDLQSLVNSILMNDVKTVNDVNDVKTVNDVNDEHHSNGEQ